MVPTGIRRNAKTKKPAKRRVFSGVSETLEAFSGTLYGSTTWTRTRDPVINSHLLYQLSYRGMACMLLIQKEKSSTCWQFERFVGTDGGLSVIGGYQNRTRGLPWPPGSGDTRCRPFAEKVRAMNHPTLTLRHNEVFA
ncbi:hypothetical protein EMIT0P44_350035 [Pseudomonas sp. IT-P44]